MSFNHDFNEYEPLANQLDKVEEKHQRRIERFYNNIQEPTLFIREIPGIKEVEYIEDNYLHIKRILKSFNSDNEIIFVTRRSLESSMVKLYKAKTEYTLEGYNTFFRINEELYIYLDKEIYYPRDQRKINFETYKKKRSLPRRYYNLLQKKYRKLFCKKYNHYNQQSYLENNKMSEQYIFMY